VEFDYRYAGSSQVSESNAGSALSFVPDLLRPPTFFRGAVRDTLAFRETLSALHDVVVSDLRFKPKDRTNYLAWRAQQQDVDLIAVARDRAKIGEEIAELRAELAKSAYLARVEGVFDELVHSEDDASIDLDQSGAWPHQTRAAAEGAPR